MPSELREAHRENDRAVEAAYGLSTDCSEADIVSHLFALYAAKTGIPTILSSPLIIKPLCA